MNHWLTTKINFSTAWHQTGLNEGVCQGSEQRRKLLPVYLLGISWSGLWKSKSWGFWRTPNLSINKRPKLHNVLWWQLWRKEHGKPLFLLWKTFWEMTRLKITKMWLKQCFKVIIILGQMLAKFNQLKRNKRLDFILLVWVQGSLFHIAAGSHPVQKAWVTR